ncbi:hypothetical protein GJAV_G00050530 [Gymnothorax javanicus]|nr:hypothetical protein GJAV_G00050530 [Gymnothorax javanicus]
MAVVQEPQRALGRRLSSTSYSDIRSWMAEIRVIPKLLALGHKQTRNRTKVLFRCGIVTRKEALTVIAVQALLWAQAEERAAMIDLSYLTEEEQEMIMTVLRRDAELKRAEEERVKQLQTLPRDQRKLKYMTGEWFYEAKSRRHMDRIHGSDIIRASMRQGSPRTRPILTQSWTAQARTIMNENQHIETLEENDGSLKQPKEERESDSPVSLQERPKPVVRSLSKRHNPFNRATWLSSETPVESDSQLNNGAGEPREEAMGESLSPSKADQTELTLFSSEDVGADLAPVAKKRTIIFKPEDTLHDDGSPFSKWGSWWSSRNKLPASPRGILKRNSSMSSNDSGHPNEVVGRNGELSGDQLPWTPAIAQEEESTESRAEDKTRDDLPYTKEVNVDFRDAATGSKLRKGHKFGDKDLPSLDHPVSLDKTRGEVEQCTDSEISDCGNGLSLAPHGTICDQPLEEESGSVGTSGTAKGSPSSLPLASESKFGWMAHKRLPPYLQTSMPASELQLKRRTGAQAETGTCEAVAKTDMATMRRKDLNLPLNPAGHYETQADSEHPQVSGLPSSMDEMGHPDDGGLVGLEAEPVQVVHSPELTEGNSIAKVLDWFSRSSDSSDDREERACYEDVEIQRAVRDQAGELESDVTKNVMVENEEQYVAPKDDLTSPGQYIHISGGSQTAATHTSQLKRPQLERSARLEEQKIACGEGPDKAHCSTEQEGIFSKSAKEDPMILKCLAGYPINTESAYQPKQRMSTVHTRSHGQRKENAMGAKEEHDQHVGMLSTVSKGRQQELKRSESVTETLPQRVVNLKSFWERGNSSSKIPISRSRVNSIQNEIEPVNQTARPKLESNVDLSKAGKNDGESTKQACLGTKNEKEVYGTCISHSSSHNLVQDIHNTVTSEDMGTGVGEQIVSTVLQEDPVEREGNHCGGPEVLPSPACMDKAQLIESGDPKASTEGEKYIAKCIVIDEDAEIPILPVEGKTNLRKFLQEEDMTPRVGPQLSPVSSSEEQSSSLSTVNQELAQPDNSVEKIRNLKDFWEREKNGSIITTGKLNHKMADTEEAPPVLMNKKSTQTASEHRIIGSDNEQSATPIKEGPNFTVMSMNQRMAKAFTGQRPGNSQFKDLCDFWGAKPSVGQTEQLPSSETRGPKSPPLKCQESRMNAHENSLFSTEDKKPYLNPDYYPELQSKDLEIANSEAQQAEEDKTHALDTSSPKNEFEGQKLLSPTSLLRQESDSSDEKKKASPSEIRSSAKTRGGKSQGRHAGLEQQNPLLHPSSREGSDQAPVPKERTIMFQKDPQRPKSTSLENAAERANLSEEQGNILSAYHENTQKELPGGRMSPHEEVPQRQLSGKSKENEQPQPLARSFLPPDHRYYLGAAEGTAFQSMPAAETEEESSACSLPELELSVESRPVQSSTPVIPDEPQPRRWSVEHDPWDSHPGTSAVDLDNRRGACETLSYSGTSSTCDDEDPTSVRKALERSKLRPASSSKSVEDLNLLPKREEERSENITRLMLSVDDASGRPSPPSSFISDATQMRNLSKSVPSFLQESSARDSDSASESSDLTGRQARIGSSLTNLSSSSGMSSVSGSVMSIYSGDFNSVEVRGTIRFSINYEQKLKEFHIFVVQCKDLAAVDAERNRSNPYVKSYLLPDQAKLGKRKTSVKKKTLNPSFNELLRYRVRWETLKTQILNLSVWHNDTFGRNSFLGEVEVDLSKWELGDNQINNLPLKPRVQSGFQASDYRGEMRLALRYLPDMSYGNKASNTGEVHIWVKDCKDLPIIRGTSINPFVKCSVLPDTSRKSRQKTRILKRTRNPAFNHTMVYDGFRTDDLQEACVELTLWDYDHIASHLVGGLRLGLGTGKSYGAAVSWMDSTDDEANVWERMMDSPTEWVEDTLPLRMITLAKNLLK